MEVDTASSETSLIKPTDLHSLEILSVTKDAQQKNGLRHSDYQRYRQYCSKRLRRLRRGLSFTNKGPRTKFVSKPVTPNIPLKDARFMHIPLVAAERAWATAMEYKTEAKNDKSRKKFGMISRLKSAAKHAQLLHEICSNSVVVDAKTKLEAQAYSAFMTGYLAFERKQWPESMTALTTAKTIYQKLAAGFAGEMKLLYASRVDDIEPLLRYGAFRVGDQSAVGDLMRFQEMKISQGMGGVEMLDDLLDQIRSQESDRVSECSWLGRSIPVKSAAVRQFLMSLAETQKRLNDESSLERETRVSLVDSLVKGAIGAQQAMRDEFKSDANFRTMLRVTQGDDKAAAAGDYTLSDAVYLYTYLTFIRCQQSALRTQLMLENCREKLAAGPYKVSEEPAKKKTVAPSSLQTKARPWQEVIRLCDLLIETNTEIANLPGVKPIDSPSIHSEIACALYTAIRCLFAARFHAVINKFPEAQALYTRTLQHCSILDSTLASVGNRLPKDDPALTEFYKRAQNELSTLQQTVKEDVLSCKATALSAQTALFASKSMDGPIETVGGIQLDPEFLKTTPLIDRLDTWVPPNFFANQTASVPPTKKLAKSKGAKNKNKQVAIEQQPEEFEPTYVQLPPDFEAIPVKPVLFDLVANEVDTLPSISDCLAPYQSQQSSATPDKASTSTNQDQQGAGYIGSMTSWLWGSKKK